MSSSYNVSLLRVTDAAGEQALAACVAGQGAEILGVGEEGAWLEGCRDVASIVLDVTSPVQLTDHRDVSALAAWLSAAAVWLQIQQIEEGSL